MIRIVHNFCFRIYSVVVRMQELDYYLSQNKDSVEAQHYIALVIRNEIDRNTPSKSL